MDDDVLCLLLIVVLILGIVLFQKIRSFWCWYYRTTAILDKLDEIERKLKVLNIQINQLEKTEQQSSDK